MTRYTPGPWTTNGETVTDRRGNIIAGIYKSHHIDGANKGDIGPAEAEANARLITCMPELLAAAEKVTQSVDEATGKVSKEDLAAAINELSIIVARVKEEGPETTSIV
jgi:hypothetical protein